MPLKKKKEKKKYNSKYPYLLYYCINLLKLAWPFNKKMKIVD